MLKVRATGLYIRSLKDPPTVRTYTCCEAGECTKITSILLIVSIQCTVSLTRLFISYYLKTFIQDTIQSNNKHTFLLTNQPKALYNWIITSAL